MTDDAPDDNTEDDEWALPWEDVVASRRNRRLQKRNPVEEGRARHLKTARPCPKCGAAPETLAWFYFESPAITWETLCGRAGWITVCDSCHAQVDFFLEALS